jgi:uncharacterized protein (TIGR03067 family)
MRRVVPFFVVLVVVPLFGSGAPQEYDDRTEYTALEGVWRLTECTQDGDQMPSIRRPTVITLRGGKFTYDDGHIKRGSYRAANAGKLCHLDKVPIFGPYPCSPARCIYQIDGDTLRIAGFPGNSDKRPRGFEDENLIIEIYKRVK